MSMFKYMSLGFLMSSLLATRTIAFVVVDTHRERTRSGIASATSMMMNAAMPRTRLTKPGALWGVAKHSKESDDDEEPSDDKTLYARLGGEAAVKAAVDEFYNRIEEDEKLSVYFDGVPMDKIREHQFSFMKTAFTVIPPDLNLHDYMINSHKRLFKLGLKGEHFDMVAGHLVGSLQSLDVPADLIDEVVATVSPLREYFVEGHDTYKDKVIPETVKQQ